MKDTAHVPKRVLIAEDEVFIALELAESLRDMGCVVVGPALNAKAAVALARTEQVDAALLDVNLGRNQTTEGVASVLRERHVPYAFLTAYERHSVQFLRSDDQVFAKPVTPGTLKDALRSVSVL